MTCGCVNLGGASVSALQISIHDRDEIDSPHSRDLGKECPVVVADML